MGALRFPLLLAVLFATNLASPAKASETPFSLRVGLSATRPSDGVFRDLFAASCVSPQFGATLRLGQRWALHMDYTRFSRSGHPQILDVNGVWTPDTSSGIKGHQNLLVAMAGYCILPRPSFSLWLRGGLLLARMGEKETELETSHSASGPVLDIELQKRLGRSLRAYGFLRWSSASKKTASVTLPDGPTLKAGGLSAGLGVSLSLTGR